MKVLVTGSSGLIGTALQRSFAEKGYDLLLASRTEAKDDGHIRWHAETGFEDAGKLEGIDAVVHLAGESVSGLRWTDDKKRAIRDSRVHGTRSVVDAISHLKKKPSVLISASGVDYYANGDDEPKTETSPAGDTFLASVCKVWEAEARRAEDSGIRTVILRQGMVLSKDGGALATMLLPFKLGIGGIVGSGKQWMSWIALDDLVSIYGAALEGESMRGAMNAASPNPVTNEEFTRTLGEVLYRPTFLPLPEFAVSMVFGEMGDALLIDSKRVVPKRLEDAGFTFEYPHLKEAIEHAVK